MPNFVEAMTGFMKANFCAALNVLGDAVTLGSELVPGPGPFINVANGLSAMVCDTPPDNLVLPPPPFTGGQCVAKYIVEYTLGADGPTPSTGTLLAIGPIRGLREEDGAGGSKRVFLQANSGVVFGGQCFNVLNPSGPQDTLLGTYTPVDGSTSRIEGVTPCGADDCGDPPIVLPPPGDSYEFGGDVTYNIDGDTTVTVPVTAVYAPIFVDLDGSLKVPVTFNVGDINFKGELEVAPNFEFNFKPTKIVAGPGKPDDEDGDGGNTGVPVPEDEEDVDVIVGVLVFSTLIGNSNNATGFPSVGGPTFLVPRIGSVQFAIKTGNSIGWTSDIDVKNLECYVPCPAPQGAIAVRVTPEAGVTRTFTPVRGKPLTSF